MHLYTANQLGNESVMKAGFKEKMSSIVQQGKDVLVWWSILTAITEVDQRYIYSTITPILVNLRIHM